MQGGVAPGGADGAGAVYQGCSKTWSRDMPDGQTRSEEAFPHLFAPLRIRGATIRNRIMSTGHDTVLPVDGTVNDALIAYHLARALRRRADRDAGGGGA